MILRLLMWLRALNSNAVFVIVWLLFFVFMGVYKWLPLEPLSVHQGAQSDRACIAYNFFNKSMDISKPRVMENINNDGIVGAEFPLISWMAAAAYKLFGYNPLWYRLLVYLLFVVGAYCTWLISAWFINKSWQKIVLLLFWNSSAIIVFYSASFLPDIPALSFTFIGWYWFFKYYFYAKARINLSLSLLFFALAGLVKATFAASILVIGALYVLEWLFKKEYKLGFKSILFLLLLPLTAIALWIYYAQWLTKTYSNTHFLQSTNMASSFIEFFANIKTSYVLWQNSLYGKWATILLLAALISNLIKPDVSQNHLFALVRSIASLYGLAFIGFLVFFNKQYVYHDYYYISAIPFLFFAGLYFFMTQFNSVSGIQIRGWWPILTLFFMVSSVGYAQKRTNERYQKGNFWYQNVHPGIDELYEIRAQIQAIVPKDAEIIVATDVTPNSMLYALQRYGTRWPDWQKERIAYNLKLNRYDYILVNDVKAFYAEAIPMFKTKPQLQYHKGIWYLYKIKN